mmetsp:Transcript_28284/g.93672  ORF Transcript_28284/g.93672 Transcript_28284/m.93672 type:complete len:217 (+) Transcript_28284:319-969(+)
MACTLPRAAASSKSFTAEEGSSGTSSPDRNMRPSFIIAVVSPLTASAFRAEILVARLDAFRCLLMWVPGWQSRSLDVSIQDGDPGDSVLTATQLVPLVSTTRAAYHRGLSSDRVSTPSPTRSCRRQSSVSAKRGSTFAQKPSSSRSNHESQRVLQPRKWTLTLDPSTSTTTLSNQRPSESRASTPSPAFSPAPHRRRQAGSSTAGAGAATSCQTTV